MRLVNLTESTWPKIGLNMTKIDEPYLFEHDRKVTTSNLNRWIWPKIEKKNWSYSPVNVRRCDDIYFIFNFWLYSTVKVCRCGNIHYIFGHVHKFRSYSFGHLYSVMLITLFKSTCVEVFNIMKTNYFIWPTLFYKRDFLWSKSEQPIEIAKNLFTIVLKY